MQSRKVLLLTYHFPPSGAVAVYRMIGLVRYLPKYGWQPIVVAPPRVPWEPEDESLLAQVPAGTPVERVPFATSFLGKIARWCAPEAHWLWPASTACRRMIHEHQPRAIFTSSPPGCVHLLGRRLQKKFGLPWLADFRDPWIINDLDPHNRVAHWLEHQVLASANVLIANTPLNQSGWIRANPDAAAKIVTIPNGFDPERFVKPESRPVGEHLTILHAGELYHNRDPRPFLDALGELSDTSLQVEFLGRQSGGLFDFPAEIENRNLSATVRLAAQVPYAEAIQRMMNADILLIVQSPQWPIGVPAKLYEYLGAGRPILALAETDSDIAWALRESGVLHRIAPPRDVPAIKQALVELTSDVRAGRPASGNPEALQQFTRERMAQRVAACLDRVVTP